MSDKTKEVIASMLTEPTGRALCDSGGTPKYDENGHYIGSTGGYGRAYERNAGMTVADWDATPAATLDARWGDIGVTVSLYHWLVNRLEYEPEFDRLFAAWSNAREDTYRLQDMEEFPYQFAKWARYEDVVDDWATIAAGHWENYPGKPDGAGWNWDETPALAAHEEALEGLLALEWINRGEWGDGPPPETPGVEGIWGGMEGPITENSYNGECALSQTIQFTAFGLDTGGTASGPFVLLQVHGGADVRGGYTTPRLFSFNGNHDPSSIFDWASVSVQAGVEDAPVWDSDDAGYSFTTTIGGMEWTDSRGRARDWTTLSMGGGAKGNIHAAPISGVPDDLAPAVARLAAARWAGDINRLRPSTELPGLFGEPVKLYGDFPDEVERAAEYLDGIEDYNFGALTLVTDDDGNAYCPVTGGKLEAWVW